MQLLVVTYPNEIENEAEKIKTLFNSGLEVLHLRKPDYTFDQYENLLKQISPKYYRKIVIHSHFKLVEKFNLRGVHFTGQYIKEIEEEDLKALIKEAKKRNLSVSASMHSIEELRSNKQKYDYVFLSPVFDSISKKGYTSGMNIKELKVMLENYQGFSKVMALGGIDENNIGWVKECGFSGAGLLGAIWLEGEAVENFKLIQQRVKLQ